MTRLIDATLSLAALVTPERAVAVAERYRVAHVVYESRSAEALVHTKEARAALDALSAAWRDSEVSGEFVAGLLVGAAHARRQAAGEVTVELVWTGPTTRPTPARRTEQVLVDLIERATVDLFLVSFVAYDVASVVEALTAACVRGVDVRFLLESPSKHGGRLKDTDPIANMRAAVPGAKLYAWTKKGDLAGGSVHAKVAVADGRVALVTSANLTGYALGKNIEAGVLIEGGHVPSDLHTHLRALVETKVVGEV